jgi:hypothetical protein
MEQLILQRIIHHLAAAVASQVMLSGVKRMIRVASIAGPDLRPPLTKPS